MRVWRRCTFPVAVAFVLALPWRVVAFSVESRHENAVLRRFGPLARSISPCDAAPFRSRGRGRRQSRRSERRLFAEGRAVPLRTLRRTAFLCRNSGGNATSVRGSALRRPVARTTRGQPHETCTNRRRSERTASPPSLWTRRGAYPRHSSICGGFVRRTCWWTKNSQKGR